MLNHHISALIQAVAGTTLVDRLLPSNLGALLAMLISAGLLIDRIKNRGKKEGVNESIVNGIGERVKKVEEHVARVEGQFVEHQRSVDRVLQQNDSLLKEIGKAEHATSQCREDMERYTIEVGSKVDEMRRDVMAELGEVKSELDSKTGEIAIALEGVKTEVRLRAEFDSRNRREDERRT